MEIIFESLAQYGVLGLWTATLLYSYHQTKKNFQERYDEINREMLDILKDNQRLLEDGLREMRDRYQEERFLGYDNEYE